MKAKLSRKINVLLIKAVARLQVFQKKPEFLTLLQAIKTHDTTDPAVLQEILAPQMPAVIFRRALGLLQIWGLTANNMLTDLGEKSLELQKIPLPEEGLYQFWWIEDSVLEFGKLPLHVTRISSWEKISGTKGKRDVANLKEKIFNSLVANKNGNSEAVSSFVFQRFSGDQVVQHGKGDKATITWNWEWNPKEAFQKTRVDLSGEIKEKGQKGKETSLSFHSEHPSPQVNCQREFENWVSGFTRENSGWDRDFQALRVPFSDGLLENEHKTGIGMAKIKNDEVTLQQYGVFFIDDFIKDIPLIPADFQQADKWRNWLIEQEVNGYLSQEDFAAIARETKHKEFFKPFQNQLENLSSKDYLQKNYAGQGTEDRFWYLQAPVDLKVQFEQTESKFSQRPINIQNQKLSLQEIAERICGYKLPDFVLYMEGQIHQSRQIRIVREFFAALTQDSSASITCLISNPDAANAKVNQPEAFLSDVAQNLGFYKDIFQERRKMPHGRFLWLKIHGEDVFYKLADPITRAFPTDVPFHDDKFDRHAKLEWTDLTITPLSEDEFPKAVIQWVKNKKLIS
ncbi:MAG: hypothetical protein DRI57_10955 [Deltaproteobacteria bacterium]|nr:MAG: hypothetical protein DRI57_10955 [Deltaproteobacteria bacterium]